MACVKVWWSVFAFGFMHMGKGALIRNNTDTEVKPTYDVNSNDQTENDQLRILQDLLTLREDEIMGNIEEKLKAAFGLREDSLDKERIETTTTTTTTAKPPPPPAQATEDERASVYEYTKQELIALLHQGRKGTNSVSPACPIPQLRMKTQCYANVMQVTVASSMNLLGQLTMEGGDGTVEIKGAYLDAFAVVGGAGQRGRLTTRLLKTDVNKNCDYCYHLTTQLYLKVGEVKCVLVGECPPPPPPPPESSKTSDRHPNQPEPMLIPTTTTTIATPRQDPTNTARTTMSLLLQGSSGLDGMEVSGPVPLSTKLSVVISAYSRDVPLDLHLVKCEARDEEGRAVVLLRDGCSVSQVLENFREVVESAGEPEMRRVSQYAKMVVFNTRAASQNITLLCTIKVCSGECPEQPSCVQSEINLGRSKRISGTLYSRQVTLAKTFRVSGFPVNRAPTQPGLVPKSGDNTQPECDCSHVIASHNRNVDPNCLSYQMVYLILGLATACYVLLALAVYYFVRRPSPYSIHKVHKEDTESPPRALYAEYNSSRRRTPQSSPEHSVSMSH